jgi:hypothetical protein
VKGIAALRAPRPHARPWTARTAAAIIATAAVALPAAACGGSGSPAGSGGSASAGGSAHSQLVAFSHCMRARGVPTWPDPTTNSRGQPVFHISDGLNVDSPQVMTAVNECQQLLPPQLHGGEPLG